MFVTHILKFAGLLACMMAFAKYIPAYGPLINVLIVLAGLWSITK